MSLRAMLWALYDAHEISPELHDGAWRVLMVLADHADDDGTDAYPSAATIGAKLGVSPRTVYRRLEALQAAGLIVHGDQRAVDRYPANRRPVVYDLPIRGVSHDMSAVTAGVTALTPRGDRNPQSGVTPAVTQTVLEPPMNQRGRASATRPTPTPGPSPVCGCGVVHDRSTTSCSEFRPAPRRLRSMIDASRKDTP